MLGDACVYFIQTLFGLQFFFRRSDACRDRIHDITAHVWRPSLQVDGYGAWSNTGCDHCASVRIVVDFQDCSDASPAEHYVFLFGQLGVVGHGFGRKEKEQRFFAFHSLVNCRHGVRMCKHRADLHVWKEHLVFKRNEKYVFPDFPLKSVYCGRSVALIYRAAVIAEQINIFWKVIFWHLFINFAEVCLRRFSQDLTSLVQLCMCRGGKYPYNTKYIAKLHKISELCESLCSGSNSSNARMPALP